MACFVIGDSLAVGVGQFRPDCETVAKVGITSEKYLLTRMPTEGFAADLIVISLGVNDGDTSETQANLETLRARVRARAVYWLLPGLKDEVRAMIRDVAAEYGDRLIDTRPEVGADHLHPSGTGYQRLASRIEGGENDDVEVAFAPAEPRVGTRYGRNYPTRVRAARRDEFGLATPRERIRRLKALRAADPSAPILRRSLSDVSFRQERLQRIVHVTAGRAAAERDISERPLSGRPISGRLVSERPPAERANHAPPRPDRDVRAGRERVAAARVVGARDAPVAHVLRCPPHMRACQVSSR